MPMSFFSDEFLETFEMGLLIAKVIENSLTSFSWLPEHFHWICENTSLGVSFENTAESTVSSNRVNECRGTTPIEADDENGVVFFHHCRDS